MKDSSDGLSACGIYGWVAFAQRHGANADSWFAVTVHHDASRVACGAVCHDANRREACVSASEYTADARLSAF